MTREIEWKYEAPPEAPLPDLRELPGVASQSDYDEVRLEATYYDTAGYDLARAGITLRHRTGGGDAGWHLKVPRGGPEDRIELRLPLGPEVPADFVDLLTARLRGRPLRPVATIATRRRRCTLAGDSGDPLAELALDTVEATTPGDQASLTRWNEIEVELADGVHDGMRLLKAADKRLRRNGVFRAQHRSKLEMTLAGVMPEPIVREKPGKSASAGEVVRAYLRTQFEALLSEDMRVRRTEPDAVHQMRVAARRSRAALQDFGRLFDGIQTDDLIRELRWLGQELGHARDAEVQRDLLVAQLDEVPGESVLGPVKARIVGHYAPRLAEAQRHAHTVLGSGRYLAFLRDFEAFIDEPPLTSDAGRAAIRTLPNVVWHSQRRVKRRMRIALNTAPGSARDVALHDVRKAAKRARYAAEATSAVVGRQARKSAKALKRVQSTLGDHHDAVIAADALRTLAIGAHAERENSYTYGLLHERQNVRAVRLVERANQQWQKANRRNRTAWMKH